MTLIDLDRHLFALINVGLANHFLDRLMLFFTEKGYVLFFPYGLYLLYRGAKQQKVDGGAFLQTAAWTAIAALVSFMLADWAGNELKNIFARVRPCNSLDNVRLLVGCSGSGSMPSNHAFNTFTVATVLFLLPRGSIPLAIRCYPFIIAALVGVSRPYVGVHYPTDVVAGAVLGISLAICTLRLHGYALKRYRLEPHATLLCGMLIALTLFRVYYILHGPLDLSPDEAHYWEWSRRLDLSYYSKGPMIAYLIRLGTAMFGDNVFGVRVMAVGLSALSSLLLYRLAILITDRKDVAVLAATLLQVIPLFSTFGIIFTIDGPFVFFWVLSLYLFYRLIAPAVTAGSSEHAVQASLPSVLFNWALLGISIGMGLLTKYTMAFFPLSGFIFFLFSDRRHILKGPGPYITAFVALFVFSPVIIWNIQHDWVTVRHTAGQAHLAEGLTVRLQDFAEFVVSQIGVVTPVLFGMLCYAIVTAHKFLPRTSARFLVLFSLPMLTFFLLKSLQGKVQANWAMTGYITAMVALAVCFLTEEARRSVRKTRLLWVGMAIALAVNLVALYPAFFKIPINMDITTRMQGWRELGSEVSRIDAALRREGSVVIFSDNYQISSELAFYVNGHPRTYGIYLLDRRMNQYDIWPDINQVLPVDNDSKGRAINGIFVMIYDVWLLPVVSDAFERCDKEVLRIQRRGQVIWTYSIFTCYHFKGLKTEKPRTY